MGPFLFCLRTCPISDVAGFFGNILIKVLPIFLINCLIYVSVESAHVCNAHHTHYAMLC